MDTAVALLLLSAGLAIGGGGFLYFGFKVWAIWMDRIFYPGEKLCARCQRELHFDAPSPPPPPPPAG